MSKTVQFLLISVVLTSPIGVSWSHGGYAHAAMVGDIDGDNDVDRLDLSLVLADRNKLVSESSCGMACDLDGDGRITVLDARRLVVLCTNPRCVENVVVEIQVNNTSGGDDDYITWSPNFSRARVIGATSDVQVILSNEPGGGDVYFGAFRDPWPPNTTATANTLSLTLPADQRWIPFVIAGQTASTNDKDAVINVMRQNPIVQMVGTHRLMVRIRKNANTLTVGERDRFLNALKALRNSNSANYLNYLTFGELHRLASTAGNEAHGQPAFLPWHRALILQVERALQQIDPSVALHYWDWDAAAPNIFTKDFMGAGIKNRPRQNSDPISLPEFSMLNPLHGWNTDLVFAGGTIQRRLFDHTTKPQAGFFTPLNDPTQASLVDATNYGPRANPCSSNFSCAVERFSHDQGHVWACNNGLLRFPSRAAGDPLFYLLHSQVDRQWAFWQRKFARHGVGVGGILIFRAPQDYDNTGNWDDPKNVMLPQNWQKGSFLEDTMWPWDGDTDGPGGRAQRPINQGGPGANVPNSAPMVPRTAFPQSRIANLWPPVPTKVKVRDMIDYLGKFRPQDGLGYAYDDVPFN
ncbi:MAG: hypothetical protein NPIRA02_13210 [Nitrospirales bacterium]|nr:MAG: hypothetical protein NPIRA02_13210 [Nitrospirales bacterium]